MPIKRLRFTKSQQVHKPQEQVVVQGHTSPHAQLTIENRSAAPFAPDHQNSAFTRVTANAQGFFKAVVPSGQEGDWIRVSGAKSPLDVRIEGIAGQDGRRAEVAQQALRLVFDGQNAVEVQSVSQNPRLSEPYAHIVFENERTGKRTKVQLDRDGHLPRGLKIEAQGSDTFRLFSTDGFHDADLKEPWALLGIADHGEPRLDAGIHRTFRFDGPLFVDGPSSTDPIQGGSIGDCYLVAAASSIAELRPQVLVDRIRDKGDGTVDVTFDRWSDRDKRYVEETVNVTRELAWSRGQLHYGRCQDADDPQRAETWWPLLEKAYAVWKGGYPAISTGYPYEIFEALLGTQGRHVDPGHVGEVACGRLIKEALEQKVPMVAWTWPDSMDRPFVGSGLISDHAYSVHGLKQEGSQTMVLLRNPWGQRRGGRDTQDQGLFWLPMSVFCENFCGLGLGQDADR